MSAEANSGLCACGCGGYTARLKHDDKARGLNAGDYSRFIHGHHHYLKRKERADWGKQYKRLKWREEIRKELAKMAIAYPKTTVERMADAVDAPVNSASRILNTARNSCFCLYGEVPEIRIRVPAPAPYERPDIANEFDTEIPFLVNSRRFVAMDEESDDEKTLHERLSCEHLQPDEYLMIKEELVEQGRHEAMMEKFRAKDAACLTYQPFAAQAPA